MERAPAAETSAGNEEKEREKAGHLIPRQKRIRGFRAYRRHRLFRAFLFVPRSLSSFSLIFCEALGSSSILHSRGKREGGKETGEMYKGSEIRERGVELNPVQSANLVVNASSGRRFRLLALVWDSVSSFLRGV